MEVVLLVFKKKFVFLIKFKFVFNQKKKINKFELLIFPFLNHYYFIISESC